MSKFNLNTIVRPMSNADEEYSVCGNTVLYKAKVVDTFPRNDAGNNIKIEILAHLNPEQVGKRYSVDDAYFEIYPTESEWRWIDAYKGTDENMTCKGYQYVMNLTHKFNKDVVLGSKGFHVCTDLKHCFKTYDYDFKNRFFKVKALVKASDYKYRNPNNTTLVAKEIKFMLEITEDPFTIKAKRDSMR